MLLKMEEARFNLMCSWRQFHDIVLDSVAQACDRPRRYHGADQLELSEVANPSFCVVRVQTGRGAEASLRGSMKGKEACRPSP